MQTAFCTFKLNSESMSTLECSNNQHYDAFSGNSNAINDPRYVDQVERGALPPGRYYILDRQSGGRLGWLRDAIKDFSSKSDRSQWLALYRDDDEIDDYTSVSNIRRGHFRLHPVGIYGISEGCVTMASNIGFDELSAHIRSMPGDIIPGTSIRYYGILEVK